MIYHCAASVFSELNFEGDWTEDEIEQIIVGHD